ncbi:MAG: hypothetical protein WBD27_14385, partial [Pyrinomonadaceae bacterium]
MTGVGERRAKRRRDASAKTTPTHPKTGTRGEFFIRIGEKLPHAVRGPTGWNGAYLRHWALRQLVRFLPWIGVSARSR